VAGAPGFELAAVVDPDPEARRYVEATPGYGVLEEALEAVECDAVLVASPPGTHPVVAKAALGAGKHVLCESLWLPPSRTPSTWSRPQIKRGVYLW
jgi:predicted dehydrogenase